MKCAHVGGGLGGFTLPVIAVPVYPGGSGMARGLNFAGGELRSITHCGGGGGASILKNIPSCGGFGTVEIVLHKEVKVVVGRRLRSGCAAASSRLSAQ